MKNAYARELDMKTRVAVDQLTEQFEASFQVYEQNQQMRFANTEEEMQSQNCELQDELAAAERALEMERNRMPTVISPPQSVAEPRPRHEPAPTNPPTSARFEPPPAARRLFEMTNPASAPPKPIPTAAPAYSPFDGLGAYAPPGLGPSMAPPPAVLGERREQFRKLTQIRSGRLLMKYSKLPNSLREIQAPGKKSPK